MLTVHEAFNQLAEGRDFVSTAALLRDITADQAATVPPNCPYSIGTQVFHMWFWQDRWLKQIDGIHTPPFAQDDSDFLDVTAGDWDGLRSRFLADFDRMLDLSKQTDLFERPTQFGDTVEVLLLRTALHHAYHVGQIVVVMRLAGFWTP